MPLAKCDLISPILADYDDLINESGCLSMREPEKDRCLEKASDTVNEKYKEPTQDCEDIVWHRTLNPSLRSCDSRHHLQSSGADKVIREIAGDCVLYATPDLTDQTGKSAFGSFIIALCVDPNKTYVSEDIESRYHSHFNDPDAEGYYRSKLVTLKEYRDKKLKYELPEVIVPGEIEKKRILGGISIINDSKYHMKCACKSFCHLNPDK